MPKINSCRTAWTKGHQVILAKRLLAANLWVIKMIISQISGVSRADWRATFTHAGGGGGRRWRWPPLPPQVHTYTWLNARVPTSARCQRGSIRLRAEKHLHQTTVLLYQRGETSNQETSCTRGRPLIQDRKSIHVLVVHGRWAFTLRSEWQKKKRKKNAERPFWCYLTIIWLLSKWGGGHICVRWH